MNQLANRRQLIVSQSCPGFAERENPEAVMLVQHSDKFDLGLVTVPKTRRRIGCHKAEYGARLLNTWIGRGRVQ